MRPRFARFGLPARLSLGAAVVLALAACSNTVDQAAPQPAAADQSAPGSVSRTPSETAAPQSDPGTVSQTPSQAPYETATPRPGAPSASPAPPPRLIAYAGGEAAGAEVQSRADAQRLHGAPASFKRFVGDLAEDLADKSTCSGEGYVGVTVETLRTDGYAVGGVNDCGGYAALWVLIDGRWREVLGTQEAWDCKVLHQYRVPSDLVGTSCYDYDANEQHSYQQA